MTESEFIEKYVLVNGKYIRLTSTQKNFIKWYTTIKNHHAVR